MGLALQKYPQDAPFIFGTALPRKTLVGRSLVDSTAQEGIMMDLDICSYCRNPLPRWPHGQVWVRVYGRTRKKLYFCSATCNWKKLKGDVPPKAGTERRAEYDRLLADAAVNAKAEGKKLTIGDPG